MKYLLKYEYFDRPPTLLLLDDFDDAYDRAVTMLSLAEYKNVHLYSCEEVSLIA